MSNSPLLLQHIRHALNTVASTSSADERSALLSITDTVLNELLLQESPEFYLDYIANGKNILQESIALAATKGFPPTPSLTQTLTKLRDDLNPELRNSIFDKQIQYLHNAFASMVETLDEHHSPAEKELLERICDWEEALYQHRGTQIDNTISDIVKPIDKKMVLTYLKNKFPEWAGLRIDKYQTLYGGFSKQTTLFETDDRLNGRQSIVFRVEQDVNIIHYDGCNVGKEYYMIKLMQKHGLPVANPLWLEDDAKHLGGRFIAMEKALGAPRGDPMQGDTKLPEAAVEAMLDLFYRLHTLKIEPEDSLAQKSHLQEWLHCKTITDANRYNANVFIPNEIERSGIQASPELIRLLRWVQNNVPECDEQPVINHLDYSFNNLLFDGDEISAILDWETSRIGDPIDDIIWTQNCLQTHFSMDEFLARYKQSTGREISAYRIAYSRVIKYLFNLIGALNAHQKLNNHNTTPIKFSLLPYKYTPMINVGLNQLIADAEAVKNKR